MKINLLFCCKYLCAAFFITFTLSCGRDIIPENPYKWEIERSEYVYLDPFYENGYYYVFSEDRDTRQSYLTKLKEIDGKIEYSMPFKVGVFPAQSPSSSTFSESNRLMLVESEFIHQFNKSTGQLIATDTFSNLIDDFSWTKDHLTACSSSDGFKSFKFFEIIYQNGHYRERKIHEEFYDNNVQINGGTPPVFSNGKWMMFYFTSEKSSLEAKNYLLTIEKDIKSKKSIGYDNNSGKIISGPLLQDDSSMYIVCVDKFFAFDKKSQEKNWETDIVGFGLTKLIGDYIYIAYAQSVEKMGIINKFTGDITTIDSRSAFSGQAIGDYLCWAQGDFYKFNTKTNKLNLDVSGKEATDSGFWGYNIGVSPNSKLLFDGKRWVCHPF